MGAGSAAAEGELVSRLAADMPRVFRWAGAIARQLRHHDIALAGKQSGAADTDALTVADLTVQELLVAALRDMGATVRACRLEAEETTGDLGRFAGEGYWTLALDPIDGTRDYRDRTGNGYAVMLHLRTPDTVRYSLLYFPEYGPHGTWLEVRNDRIVVGPDDPDREARAVLDALPAVAPTAPLNRRILVNGFFERNGDRARAVSAAGFDAALAADPPGSLYPLLARGIMTGALFHTPNVYDFPVCIHVARALGGDAVWAHDGRPVNFRSVWHDTRAKMLRLPGIVACALDRRALPELVRLARGWPMERYASPPSSSSTAG